MDGGERPRQVDPRVDDLAHRPAAPALQPVLEALAARQLHHETGDAARVVALERVAADHVGVLDAVERAGLVDDRRAPPLRFERRRDDVGGHREQLDRDLAQRAPVVHLFGEPHRSERAAAEALDQPVRAEARGVLVGPRGGRDAERQLGHATRYRIATRRSRALGATRGQE